MKKELPKKKRRKRLLRLTALLLLFGVFVFSLVMLLKTGISYVKNRAAYRAIRSAAEIRETAAPAKETAFFGPSLPAPSAEPAVTPEPLPVSLDWEALKTVCPDIVGWLYLEGTGIHYPVVQGTDNEYYLTHNARREENAGGALFLDAGCGKACRNLIVYGHRMKDDSMFGTLPEYAHKAYLAEHPIMYYLTPEQNYRVEIFACRTVNAEAKYFTTHFSDDDAYRRYLDKAVEQSYWSAPVPPSAEYNTLTLVTCSVYEGLQDPRLLVHGRLVPLSS